VTEDAVGDFSSRPSSRSRIRFSQLPSDFSCARIFLYRVTSWFCTSCSLCAQSPCRHQSMPYFLLVSQLAGFDLCARNFPVLRAGARAVSAVCLFSRGVLVERCFSLERAQGLRFRSSRAVGLGSVRIPECAPLVYFLPIGFHSVVGSSLCAQFDAQECWDRCSCMKILLCVSRFIKVAIFVQSRVGWSCSYATGLKSFSFLSLN
jgi:hypothetical protein